MRDEKSSMLYWWPKIKDLDIPMPKTEIIKLNILQENLTNVCDGDFSPLEPYISEIKKKAQEIGYPLFLRTDHLSAKHDWKETCFVKSEDNLFKHIKQLIETSFMCDMIGLPVNALVLREYIPMKNLFTAFHGDMPVNPEIRAFIKDGKLQCTHWYWIEEAIIKPSIENWREILAKSKTAGHHIKSLDPITRYVTKVAEIFKEDYWSVDFCKAKDGRWILIDMAEGERSWHPDCKNKILKKDL